MTSCGRLLKNLKADSTNIAACALKLQILRIDAHLSRGLSERLIRKAYQEGLIIGFV